MKSLLKLNYKMNHVHVKLRTIIVQANCSSEQDQENIKSFSQLCLQIGLKKNPEILITLPTINYPATLFHIFIFMKNYANFFLIMPIYENFMKILMKFFDEAKEP